MDNLLEFGVFSEGFAKVKVNQKRNFIDKKGKLLFDEWLEFNFVRDFFRGYATVGKFFNPFGCEFGFVELATLLSKQNFIDKEGNFLFDEWFDNVSIFSEGYSEIRKDGKSNFIDKEGNLLFNEWLEFNFVSNFSEGYVLVQRNELYNFIDKGGNFLFEEWFDRAGNFSEGYATIKKNGKWNFVDKEGNFLFEEWSDEVGNFLEGYATVKEDGKWNFVDKEGNLLFDEWIEFGVVGNFSEGYVKVSIGGPYIQDMKYNFIDKEGNLLFEEWFDRVGNFSEGYITIKEDGKWNFIDKEGNYLCNDWYDDVREFSEGYAKVEKDGKQNFIDKNGKLLLDDEKLHSIYSSLDISKISDEKIKQNQSSDGYKDLSEISLSEFQEDMKKMFSELDISEQTQQSDLEPTQTDGVEVVFLGREKEVPKCKQENKTVEKNQHGFVVNKEREEIKQKVFEKKGYICSDCGAKEDLDVHHILPRHMGGKDVVSNLKVLCRDCHEKLHGYEIDGDKQNKGKGLSKKLTLIHKAMDENLKLFIVYKKFDEDQEDSVTRRVIDPMELYYENGRQYLKAYCHLREQQRNFRISRITKIELR